MISLQKPASVILEKCMALKKGESCLVVSDEAKLNIASALVKSAELITSNVKLAQIPVPRFDGDEPPAHVAEEMKSFDVILLVTSKSLSWTDARENASKAGARIASMPKISEETMQRAIDIHYGLLAEQNSALAKRMASAETIRITSASGTDLSLSTKGREWHCNDIGIYDKPGDWGNLPSGEVFAAPVEGTANGTFVIDASMAGIGKIENPITVKIKDGFAVEFIGSSEARSLKDMLAKIRDKNAFNIAEIGIGTNPKARICGNVLEDEKVMGTCHIAFGNSSFFGGAVNVPIHVDGILKSPTIEAGGKLVMESGKFVF